MKGVRLRVWWNGLYYWQVRLYNTCTIGQTDDYITSLFSFLGSLTDCPVYGFNLLELLDTLRQNYYCFRFEQQVSRVLLPNIMAKLEKPDVRKASLTIIPAGCFTLMEQVFILSLSIIFSPGFFKGAFVLAVELSIIGILL